MALDLNDKTTWTPATLETPDGGVDYYVLNPDKNNWYEQYGADENLTRCRIKVAWGDALKFKKYALGTTEYAPGLTYFTRYGPLAHPTQEGQYLESLKSVEILPGLKAPGSSQAFAPAEPNELLENWPDFPNTAPYLRAMIVYEAVFRTLSYDVQNQDDFRAAGSNELTRFVRRYQRVNTRERKLPGYAVEYDQAGPAVYVQEAGFVPFFDYTLYRVWYRVPEERVPWSAIENCIGKINDALFDVVPKTGALGRYRIGDVMFSGLAGGRDIIPYRGPSGEWLVDVPYTFRFQPADGLGDGMLKIPTTAANTWKKIRVRGTSGSPQPIYGSANLDTLFQPEP